MRFTVLHVARLSFFALLLLSMAASENYLLNQGQKVYVVGVRDTCGLACGACYAMLPDGRPLLDRFAPDPALQSAAIKEFRKEGRYVLADSAEKADFVFIIEGDYKPLPVTSSPVPGYVIGVTAPDQKPDHLLGVSAIAVPASIYREAPTDWQALFRARLWGGCQNTLRIIQGRVTTDAKPETLVRTFPDKGKKPPGASPIVCMDFTREQAGRQVELPEKSNEAAIPATSQAAAKVSIGGSPIKVNVDFVSVPVAASDVNGKYIPDLKKSDFHLFEDDVEQEIDRLVTAGEPLNAALLIDSSWSMALKFDQVQQSALSFVEAMRPEDRVMVVSFDDGIHLDSEFTNDRLELRRAILATRRAWTTRLYDAVDLALTERLNPIIGRKAIVLFTDGVDTSSWLADSARTLAEVEESNVILYAVQLETWNDETSQLQPGWVPEVAPGLMAKNAEMHAYGSRFLQDLASRSGGRFFQVAAMDNTVDAFAQVADELRHQYMLGYYPSNRARDGSYRRIRVTVDRPGVRIRARSEYRAAMPSAGK